MLINLILLSLLGIAIFVAWIFSEIYGSLKLRLFLGILAILSFLLSLFLGFGFLIPRGEIRHMKKTATYSFLYETINALEHGKTDLVIKNLKTIEKDFETHPETFDYIRSVIEYSRNLSNDSYGATQQGGAADALSGRR